MKSLTQNQELYCQARHRGLTQRLAYREAYPKSQASDDVIDRKASDLERKAEVSGRLQELNQQSARKATLSKTRLLNRLDNLADKAEEHAVVTIERENGNTTEIFDVKSADIAIKATRELLPYAQDDIEEKSPFVADFGLLIAPPFLAPHRAIANGTEHDFWTIGGRISAKSSWGSLEIVDGLMKHRDRSAIIFMKNGVDLRGSVYEQFLWAVETLNIGDKWKGTVSPMRIVNKETGQAIVFRGLDKASKTKGIKAPNGTYYAYQWFEECDLFRGMAEIRTARQSATRGAPKDAEFFRFYICNPPRSKQNWVNKYIAQREADGLPVYRSSYLDVPREWVPDQAYEDAEELKRIDQQAYEHEYLGMPVGLGGDVFDRVEFREITDEEIAQFDFIHCGQDFGWFPDPWAFTMSEWQPGQRQILTFFEDGGNKLQPNEQAERIIQALTWADGDKDPEYHYLEVKSDDADPTSIAAQYEAGVNARQAHKGHLRTASYNWLSSVKWVIDPARCPKLAEEVRGMQYEQNKDGEWLNSIPDGNDHYVDSVRYAFMDIVRRARDAYRATQDTE